MTNEEFEQKLLNGTFKEKELKDIPWGLYNVDYHVIEELDGDDHRWTRDIATIFEFKGKLYELLWDRGLTELQENSFYNQPYEVIKKEEVITKTITTYEKI